MNDQQRLILLDKCFDLGLPASSNDDIQTLKMYLDLHLDTEIISFPVDNKFKRKDGIKLRFLKMLFN